MARLDEAVAFFVLTKKGDGDRMERKKSEVTKGGSI